MHTYNTVHRYNHKKLDTLLDTLKALNSVLYNISNALLCVSGDLVLERMDAETSLTTQVDSGSKQTRPGGRKDVVLQTPPLDSCQAGRGSLLTTSTSINCYRAT